jgi:hypothetical protein
MSTSTSNHQVGHNTINELAANSEKHAGNNSGATKNKQTILDVADSTTQTTAIDTIFEERNMDCYEKTTYLNIFKFDNIAIMAELNYHLANEATNDEREPYVSNGYLDKLSTFIQFEKPTVFDFTASQLCCLHDFAKTSLDESPLAYVNIKTVKDIYIESDTFYEIFYNSLKSGDVNYHAEESADNALVDITNLADSGLAGEITVRYRDCPIPITYYFNGDKEIYSEKRWYKSFL